MHDGEKAIELKLELLDQLQSKCTHCGICSEVCATFQSTGWEHDSPRGRIKLAAQFIHGHIRPDSAVLETFDECLGCQACERACPLQVAYHPIRRIVQELRSDLQTSSFAQMEKHIYRKWVILAKRISNPYWRHYGAKWLPIPSSLRTPPASSYAKQFGCGQSGNAKLAVCCLQDLFQHGAISSTLQFMQKIGHPVEIDPLQPCCGAIFERLVHGGKESICYPDIQKKAALLQKKRSASFLKWMTPQTYFLSRCCQNIAGENGDLYRRIGSILDQNGIELQLEHPLEIYYQPYCRGSKGDSDSILTLLHRIKNLIIKEFPNPYTCCGGYCGETVLHPEHAQELAKEKIASLPNRATIVTASFDCWSMFKTYAENREWNVSHPMEIIANSKSANQSD